MARMPYKMLNKLKEARRCASLETASFGMPTDRVVVNGKEVSADEYIKERIRNHHASWVLYPLDTVIEWAEGKDK